MSQPPLGPRPSAPPGGASSSRRGPLVGVAVGAVVLGLLAGVLTGYLLFHDGAGSGSRAEADVDAGCVIIERFDDQGGLEIKELPGLDEPDIWELQAASALFTAASKADKDLERWEDPGTELYAGLQRIDQKAMDAALDTLVDLCADR